MPLNGYYPMYRHDAIRVGKLIADCADERTWREYGPMALYCFSQLLFKGKPCPYFTTGATELARECLSRGSFEARRKRAIRFLRRCEDKGYVVRIGKEVINGKAYVKRTFHWLAEGADGVEIPNSPVTEVSPPVTEVGKEASQVNCILQEEASQVKRISQEEASHMHSHRLCKGPEGVTDAASTASAPPDSEVREWVSEGDAERVRREVRDYMLAEMLRNQEAVQHGV